MNFNVTALIWMFFAGACAAVISVYYNNHFLGNMVRALIEKDAVSPETAVSCEEINIKLSAPLKYALRPNSSFSQIVIKTTDDRYYIAEDRFDLAKVKYRSKDCTITFVIVSIIILLIVTVALSFVLPDLVEGLVQKVSEYFGEGKTL